MSIHEKIIDECIAITKLSKGDQIAELRNNLGLTQQEFGDILGVTKLCVCRWEIGDRKIKGPALILINILCKYDLWSKEING